MGELEGGGGTLVGDRAGVRRGEHSSHSDLQTRVPEYGVATRRGYTLLLYCWHALPGASKQSGQRLGGHVPNHSPQGRSAMLSGTLATVSCAYTACAISFSTQARHVHDSRKLGAGPAYCGQHTQRLVGTPARQQGCMSKSMVRVGKLDLRRHALIGLVSLAHVRPGEMPDRHVSRGRCSLCTYRICHLSCSVACLLVQPTPGQKCARRSQCNIDRYCAAARRLTLERLGLKGRASSGLR